MPQGLDLWVYPNFDKINRNQPQQSDEEKERKVIQIGREEYADPINIMSLSADNDTI